MTVKKTQDKSAVAQATEESVIEEQARDQTGQTKVRVVVDESQLQTCYANGFRPTASPEEVMIDFGMNKTRMTGEEDVPYEVLFKGDQRVIMSHYATKRLAIELSKVVRSYEQQFGEIELNVGKRQIKK